MKARTHMRIHDLRLSTANIFLLNSAKVVIQGPAIEVVCDNGEIASQLSVALNELGANAITRSSKLDSSNESRIVAIQAQPHGGDEIIISLRSGYDSSNIDIISTILGLPTEKKLIFTLPSAFSTVTNLELLNDLQGPEVHLSESTSSTAAAAAAPLVFSRFSKLNLEKIIMPPKELISKLTSKFKGLFNHTYQGNKNLVVEFNSYKDGSDFSNLLKKLGIVNAAGNSKAVDGLWDENGVAHHHVVIMNLANMNELLDLQMRILGLDGFKPYTSDQDLILS